MLLVWLNLCIFLWICVGVGFRKRPKIHIPLMLIAFVADLALLVAVELQNQAMEKATRATGFLLPIHIIGSFIFLFCYLCLIVTGTKRYRKTGGKTHLFWAVLFLINRFINCSTAFFL